MKKLAFLMIVLILGFLSGCAQMSPIASTQSNEIRSADLRAIDPSNHDAVAKHYEDAAEEMKAELQAQKKLLEEYEGHSYYYGQKGQDVQSHTKANIQQYEKSIKENMKEAVIHRKMAQNEKEHNFTTKNRDLGLLDERNVSTQLN